MKSFELHCGPWQSYLPGLPDDSIDVTIMDPPYSAKVHGSSMRGASGWQGSISEVRDLGFDPIELHQIYHLSAHVARLTRRWVLVFSDIESAHLWKHALEVSGLEYIRTGLWIKVGGAPQFTGDRPAVGAEAITIAHRPGRKRWNGGGRPAVWSVPIVLERGNGERRLHTTQKPEGLMSALVRDFSDRGDLILDPVFGSCTTGAAALAMGRRFAGSERLEPYFNVGKRRLEGTREHLELFPTSAREEQVGLEGISSKGKRRAS